MLLTGSLWAVVNRCNEVPALMQSDGAVSDQLHSHGSCPSATWLLLPLLLLLLLLLQHYCYCYITAAAAATALLLQHHCCSTSATALRLWTLPARERQHTYITSCPEAYADNSIAKKTMTLPAKANGCHSDGCVYAQAQVWDKDKPGAKHPSTKLVLRCLARLVTAWC